MSTLGSLQSLTYNYDPKGNVSALSDGRHGDESLAFTYDHLDRLAGIMGGLNESYDYNQIGNFTSKGDASYTYPPTGSARPHAPTEVQGFSYGYDLIGNLTSAEGQTYGYDVENRLVGVSGGGLPSCGFAHDGDARIWWISENGGETGHSGRWLRT